MTWLLIALGAGLGATARFTIGAALDGRWPQGTLLVNLVGSFLLGWFTGLGLSGAAIAFLGVGLCGGLTTFSSLMVQSVDRGPRLGTAYLCCTVVGALLATSAGFLLAG